MHHFSAKNEHWAKAKLSFAMFQCYPLHPVRLRREGLWNWFRWNFAPELYPGASDEVLEAQGLFQGLVGGTRLAETRVRKLIVEHLTSLKSGWLGKGRLLGCFCWGGRMWKACQWWRWWYVHHVLLFFIWLLEGRGTQLNRWRLETDHKIRDPFI